METVDPEPMPVIGCAERSSGAKAVIANEPAVSEPELIR